jgi:hypothetical protein
MQELATKGDILDLGVKVEESFYLIKWMLGIFLAATLLLVIEVFFVF